MSLDTEIQRQKNQITKLNNDLLVAEKKIRSKKGDITEVSTEALRNVGLSVQSIAASMSSMAMSSVRTTENLAQSVLKNVVGSKERLLLSTVGQINPILGALASKMLDSAPFQNLIEKTKSKFRIPRLQKGGLVGKGGVFQLHAGEVVVPYKETKKLFAKEMAFNQLAKDSMQNRKTLNGIRESTEMLVELFGGEPRKRSGKAKQTIIEGFNQFNTHMESFNEFVEHISKTILKVTKFVEVPLKFLYRPRGGYLKYLPKDTNVLSNISKTLQVIFTFSAERLDSLRNFGRESALALRSLLSYFTGVNLPPLRDDIERPWTVRGLFSRSVKAWRRSKQGTFFKNIVKSWTESRNKGFKRPFVFAKGLFNRPIQFYKELQQVEEERATAKVRESILGPITSPFVTKENNKLYKQTEWKDYITGKRKAGKFTGGIGISSKILKDIDANILKIYNETIKISKDISKLVSEEGLLQVIDVLFERKQNKQVDETKKQTDISKKIKDVIEKERKDIKNFSKTVKESVEKFRESVEVQTESSKKASEGTQEKLDKLPKKIVKQMKKKLFNIYNMFGFFRRLFSPKNLLISSLVGGLAYKIMKIMGGKGGFGSIIKTAVAAGMFATLRAFGFRKTFNLLLSVLSKLGGFMFRIGKSLGIAGSVVGTSALMGGVKGYAQAQSKYGKPVGRKLGLVEKTGLAAGEALKWGTFGLVDITQKAESQAARSEKARENLRKTSKGFLARIKWRMSDKAYMLLKSIKSDNAGEVFGNLVHSSLIVQDKNKMWVTKEEFLSSLPNMKEKIKFELEIGKKKLENLKKDITQSKTYKFIVEKSKEMYLNSIKPFASNAVTKILEKIKDSRTFDALVNSGIIVHLRNKWVTREEMLRSNPKTSGRFLERRLSELSKRYELSKGALGMMEKEKLLKLNEETFVMMLKRKASDNAMKLILSGGSLSASQSFIQNVTRGKILRYHGKWITSEEFLTNDLNLNKANKLLVKEITQSTKNIVDALKQELPKHKNIQKAVQDAAVRRFKKNCSPETYNILTSSGKDNLDEKFNNMVLTNQIVKIHGKWQTVSEVANESKVRFLGSSGFISLLNNVPIPGATPILSAGPRISKEDLMRSEATTIRNQNKAFDKFTKEIRRPLEEQAKASMKVASDISNISNTIVNNNVSTVNNAGVIPGNIIDPNAQKITQGLVP